MASVLILTGGGRYSDRWHDHAATSQQVAEVLHELGHTCRIRETRRPAFAGIASADLVVVNCGCGRIDPEFDGSDEEWKPALDAFADHVRSGGPVLALHTACNTFHALPEWFDWLGGRWVAGTSMHPPIGQTTVQVRTGAHPIVADLADFTLYDERYSRLVVDPAVEPLVTHELDGRTQPLVWAREVGTAGWSSTRWGTAWSRTTRPSVAGCCRTRPAGPCGSSESGTRVRGRRSSPPGAIEHAAGAIGSPQRPGSPQRAERHMVALVSACRGP